MVNLLFLDQIQVDGHDSLGPLRVVLLVVPMQQQLLIVDHANSWLPHCILLLLLLLLELLHFRSQIILMRPALWFLSLVSLLTWATSLLCERLGLRIIC